MILYIKIDESKICELLNAFINHWLFVEKIKTKEFLEKYKNIEILINPNVDEIRRRMKNKYLIAVEINDYLLVFRLKSDIEILKEFDWLKWKIEEIERKIKEIDNKIYWLELKVI